MIENPSFESSEDNVDWSDGGAEVPGLSSVAYRISTKCPHCDGEMALNYSARGIVFDHDDLMAQLEAENVCLRADIAILEANWDGVVKRTSPHKGE